MTKKYIIGSSISNGFELRSPGGKVTRFPACEWADMLLYWVERRKGRFYLVSQCDRDQDYNEMHERLPARTQARTGIGNQWKTLTELAKKR